MRNGASTMPALPFIKWMAKAKMFVGTVATKAVPIASFCDHPDAVRYAMIKGVSPTARAPVRIPTQAPIAQCRNAVSCRSLQACAKEASDSERGGADSLITLLSDIGAKTPQSSMANPILRTRSGKQLAAFMPRTTPLRPQPPRHAAATTSQWPSWNHTIALERVDVIKAPVVLPVACRCVRRSPGSPVNALMPRTPPSTPVIP
mmetsp:Transcript_124611/g.278120  ORF Transcript_124611/g.278120 Transcript_124611/m.278120 type:complete len:204 (+) Transcript_124611:287-898(+)